MGGELLFPTLVCPQWDMQGLCNETLCITVKQSEFLDDCSDA